MEGGHVRGSEVVTLTGRENSHVMEVVLMGGRMVML